MAVDSQGVVYVTDQRDCCVQKFSISGQFIGQFGSLHTKEGKLTGLFGIAIDDKDYVHISEPTLQRVSIFTSTGEFIHCFRTGDEDEDLDSEDEVRRQVTGLAIDKSGNLYACMPLKGQVVIF